MKQSEIEYLLLEAKKCQGMVKDIDSDFEFESYAKITPHYKNSSAAEKEYTRIIDSAENKNFGYNGQADYETLCSLISNFKGKYHSKATLEAEIDSTKIIESLEDMKAIAEYYARKDNSDSAEDASGYIAGVIEEGKKYRGLFSRKVYSGKIGIEAIAADLFKGTIDKDYTIKNFEYADETSNHPFENMPLYSDDYEEEPKHRRKSKREDENSYSGACEILMTESRRLYAESKKESGNIFEKIFYSIIYPGF